ncbi:MAG: DUF4142 domain-containing protein [Ferruginibacter sp.]
MKKVKFFMLVSVISISQACNDNTKDSVAAAKDSNASMDNPAMATGKDTTVHAAVVPVSKDDADFAVEAANGGMMEVQLGNYAQQNALSPRVKEFGAMMTRDHTKANDELKGIAASKSITLPAESGDKAKKEMEDLMKKKGKDFDKAYMNMMLDDHKKDVKEFEKAANDCKDPEIKSFAGKTLPVLRVHLDSAKAISGKN